MNISRHLRKPYVYLFLVVMVIITSVVSFSYKYKNQIATRLIREIGEQTGLTINVERSSISIFKTFPDVRLDLENLSVVKGSTLDSLAFIERVSVAFDVEELRQGIYNIRYLGLEKGYLHLFTRKDGTDNYSFTLPERSASDTSRWHFNLEEVRLAGTEVQFVNQAADRLYIGMARDIRCRLKYEKKIINMIVDGNLLLDEVTLSKTTYFRDKSVTVRGKLLYDTPLKSLAINQSRLVVESTDFEVDGTMDFAEKQQIDLRIKVDESTLKNLASLAPGSMNDELENYSAKGRFYLNASIQGDIDEGKEQNIYMELGCQNTSVSRVNSPYVLDSLNFSAIYQNNLKDSIRSTYLNIQNLNVKLGAESLTGSLEWNNAQSPYMAVELNGEIDLAVLSGFLARPELRISQGKALLNVDAQGDWSDMVSKSRYSNSSDIGTLLLDNVHFTLQDSARLYRISQAKISATPNSAVFDMARASVGSTDLAGKVAIDNWAAATVSPENTGPVTYQFEGFSEKLQVGDFLPDASSIALHQVEWIGGGTMPRKYHRLAAWMESASLYTRNLRFQWPKEKRKATGDLSFSIRDGDVERFRFFIRSGEGLTNIQGNLKGLRRWYNKRNAHCQVNLKASAHHVAPSEYLNISENWPQIVNLQFDGRISAPLQLFSNPDSSFFQKIQSSSLRFVLSHSDLPLSALRGSLRFVGNGLEIKVLDGKLGENYFHLMGEVQQYASLLTEQVESSPELTLFLKAKTLDLENLMQSLEALKKEINPTQPHWKAISLNCRYLDAEIEALRYEKMLLKNFKATGSLWGMNTLLLDTARAIFAGGITGFNGRFSLTDSLLLFNSRVENVSLASIFDMVGENNSGVLPMRKASGFTDASSKAKLHFKKNRWQLDWSRSYFQSTFHISNGNLYRMEPLVALNDQTSSRALRSPTSFRDLKGKVVIDSGRVYYPKFEMQNGWGTLFLAGLQQGDTSARYLVELPLSMVEHLPSTVLETMPPNMAQFLASKEVMEPALQKAGRMELFPVDHQQYGGVHIYLKLITKDGKSLLVYDRQEAAGKIRLLPESIGEYLPRMPVAVSKDGTNN